MDCLIEFPYHKIISFQFIKYVQTLFSDLEIKYICMHRNILIFVNICSSDRYFYMGYVEVVSKRISLDINFVKVCFIKLK